MKQKELINGMILTLLGAWIWWYSNGFPSLEEGYPGPSLFPKLIGLGLLLAGFSLLVEYWRGRKTPKITEEGARERKDWPRFLLGIVILSVYPFLQPLTGFLPALAIICFGMGLLLRVKPLVAAITAVATAGLLQFLFSNLLGVAL